MITIIGTGHVFGLREKVKRKITEKKPEAVCLELDEERYKALLSGDISRNPLSLFQQAIASIYGERAGNDMIGGIEGAREVKARILLIDRDIDKTMEKLMYASIYEFFNPIELLRKFFVMFSKPIKIPSDFKGLKGLLEGMIREFEADPEKYRDLLGEIYPLIKRVLLDEREEHMAKEIREIRGKYDRTVVITGAGHVSKLRDLLKDLDVEVIKLGELML